MALIQYGLFGTALLSLLIGVQLWWFKLEPLRIHRGESGVRPDRYGEFLNPEWYMPEARIWLRVVSALWLVAFVALLAGFFVMLSRAA